MRSRCRRTGPSTTPSLGLTHVETSVPPTRRSSPTVQPRLGSHRCPRTCQTQVLVSLSHARAPAKGVWSEAAGPSLHKPPALSPTQVPSQEALPWPLSMLLGKAVRVRIRRQEMRGRLLRSGRAGRKRSEKAAWWMAACLAQRRATYMLQLLPHSASCKANQPQLEGNSPAQHNE